MKIDKILISEEELQQKVQALGEQIRRDYQGDELIVIGVLKGCFVFISDLLRKLDAGKTRVYFMELSSYGNGTQSSGKIQIKKDLDEEIQNKDVLIVEDIIDSGITLSWLKETLSRRGPKSLKICTMFSKPSRRRKLLHVDYIGFEVPDEFVVGYGLDYAEQYRGLPYLAVLSESSNIRR